MNSVAISMGYKQSEVGVIPEDWDLKRLGEIALVTAGGTPSRAVAAYWNGDIPWITTAEIDFRSIQSAQQFITQLGLNNSAAELLPPGTLLMALYGQGKTRGKVALLGIEAATNQACAAISFCRSVSSRFVFHFLSSQYENIRTLSNTGNQENLNSSLVRSISIPLPPRAEQEAIAEALSDADAHIELLEKLIAKKRKIKQGAMQELLTGKRRLPGFSEEWETRRFDELFSVLRNASNSRSELSEEGEVAYVHYGDIHTHTTAFLDVNTKGTFISRSKVKSIPRLVDGDLLMADASEDTEAIGKAVEIVNLNGQEAVAGLHTMVLRANTSSLAIGFRGYLQYLPMVRSALVRLATGVSVYGITKTGVKAIEVTIPKPAEQAAIAAILNDMDAEIAALEDKLAKARNIKQGMMRELLTGRVRMV